MLMPPEAAPSLPAPNSPAPTGFSPPHLDPHDTSLEPAFASGIELLGLQRALDRLHRVVHRVQVTSAPALWIDRLVAAKLQPVLEPPKHVHVIGALSLRPECDAVGLALGG